MGYRTLLVHLDRDSRAAVRTQVALRLARGFDAHVSGVAPTGLIDLPIALDATASLGQYGALAWDLLRTQANEARKAPTPQKRPSPPEKASAAGTAQAGPHESASTMNGETIQCMPASTWPTPHHQPRTRKARARRGLSAAASSSQINTTQPSANAGNRKNGA